MYYNLGSNYVTKADLQKRKYELGFSVDTFQKQMEQKITNREKTLDRHKYVGSSETVSLFQELFPNLVATRAIGILKEDTDQIIHIRPLRGPLTPIEPSTTPVISPITKPPKELFIGSHVAGIAAAMSSFLQQHHSHSNSEWLVDDLTKSAAAGSGSYGHERDSVAINFDFDIGPLSVLQEELKHFFRPVTPQEAKEPHFVKINLHWRGLFEQPRFVWLMLTNFYYQMRDSFLETVGSYDKTYWAQTLRNPQEHRPIEKLENHLSEPLFILAKDGFNSIHVAFTKKEADLQLEIFHRINYYAPNPFYLWPQEKINQIFPKQFPDLGTNVAQVVQFPRDYLINPFLFLLLQKLCKERGVGFRDGFKLTSVFVEPHVNRSDNFPPVIAGEDEPIEGCQVAGIEGLQLPKDGESGEPRLCRRAASLLFTSLGPKVKFRYAPLEENSLSALSRHCWECFLPSKEEDDDDDEDQFTKYKRRYTRTARGFLRHAINYITSFIDEDDPNKLSMKASGISMTTMVVIPKDEPELVSHLDSYTRQVIGTTNSHWILLERKETTLMLKKKKTELASDQQTEENEYEEKEVVCYALRGTAGGVFPCRYASPNYAVNNLENQKRLLGDAFVTAVEEGRAAFEFVECRSCSRDVSALNGFLLNKLAHGFVNGYAYGGVGLVNGVAIGELGRCLLTSSQAEDERLWKGEGIVSQACGGQRLFEGVNFKKILGLGQLRTARRLGLDESFSPEEKSVMAGSSLAGLALGKYLWKRGPLTRSLLLGGTLMSLGSLLMPAWMIKPSFLN